MQRVSHPTVAAGGLPIAESALAAEGWDGDLTVVAESKAGKVALTLSTWDSVDDASEFAKALQKRNRKGPTRQVAIVVRQTEMNVAYAFSRDESLARKAVDEATLAGKVVRR